MQTTATPTTLTKELYMELYNYLCDLFERDGECDDDEKSSLYFDFESEDGHYFISGDATAYFRYEDDSFDHAFGTWHGGHYEFDKLDEVSVESCIYVDDDENESEIEFDCEVFAHLHDKTTVKINGMTINRGDVVVAKGYFGKWFLATFLYYDPIEGIYHWNTDKSPWKSGKKMLPATIANCEFVGKY